MTCKDCIHYEICEFFEKECGIQKADTTYCEYFKDISKGCEFCCQEYSVDDWRHGAPHEFRIKNRGLYAYDVIYGWEGIQIKYCPICGRPLGRKRE